MPERERVGTIECLNSKCGQDIPVKRGSGGALSVCCIWCDLSAYAKRGTLAYRHIEQGMRPVDPDEPEPSPAAPAAPKPKPSPKSDAVAQPAPEPAPKPAPKPVGKRSYVEDMPWLK